MIESYILPILIAGAVVALILYLRKHHSGS